MANENPGGDLGNGPLPQPQSGLTAEQLAANTKLVLSRFDQRFGLDDAGITNPALQHSLDHPEQHGF